MNVVDINHKKNKYAPAVPKALFAKMEGSLKSAGCFEKNVKLAKILAPILQDQSSNERHLCAIHDEKTPIQEKILAIIMLGFPKNRPVLAVLHTILTTSCDSMRIAAAIAIAQMRDGRNNDVLSDVLMAGFKATTSPEVKKAIRQAIVCVADNKFAPMLHALMLGSES